MADHNDRTAGSRNDADNESTYSGALGERNRNTPGRTPRELGLDPEEMRGHEIGGDPLDIRTSDVTLSGPEAVGDKDAALRADDVDGRGEGGISMSGGRAGGERGLSGTSDSGAGGPEGESRGGPGQYKSTSRFDLDHGTVDET